MADRVLGRRYDGNALVQYIEAIAYRTQPNGAGGNCGAPVLDRQAGVDNAGCQQYGMGTHLGSTVAFRNEQLSLATQRSHFAAGNFAAVLAQLAAQIF